MKETSKNKLREKIKGKKLGPRSQEVKEKIRNSLLGKKHSPERIENNRKGQLKRYNKVANHCGRL